MLAKAASVFRASLLGETGCWSLISEGVSVSSRHGGSETERMGFLL